MLPRYPALDTPGLWIARCTEKPLAVRRADKLSFPLDSCPYDSMRFVGVTSNNVRSYS
jgi:hypothetical protein